MKNLMSILFAVSGWFLIFSVSLRVGAGLLCLLVAAGLLVKHYESQQEHK